MFCQCYASVTLSSYRIWIPTEKFRCSNESQLTICIETGRKFPLSWPWANICEALGYPTLTRENETCENWISPKIREDVTSAIFCNIAKVAPFRRSSPGNNEIKPSSIIQLNLNTKIKFHRWSLKDQHRETIILIEIFQRGRYPRPTNFNKFEQTVRVSLWVTST